MRFLDKAKDLLSQNADKVAFVKFPYKLYAGDPNFVPPLLMVRAS